MMSLYFGVSNFCERHDTLRKTLAVAAGLTDHVWNTREMLEQAFPDTLNSRLWRRSMPADFSRYEAMRQEGATPHEVWRAATSDGLQWIEAFRLVRRLFDLSLIQAKEVKIQAEGFEGTLSEYQEQVILPMFEEGAREGLFDDSGDDSSALHP